MNLISKILQASNIINKSARKGSSNWIISSPALQKALLDLERPEIRKKKILKIFDYE
jgi:hypothetical protein